MRERKSERERGRERERVREREREGGREREGQYHWAGGNRNDRKETGERLRV